MEDVTVYPRRGVLLAFAAGSAVLVAGGAWLVLAPGSRPDDRVLGSCALVFFGLCLAFCLRRLADRGPSLVIDEQGVLDRASLAGAGRLSWSEIAGVTINVYKGQRFLGLLVREPEAIMRRHPLPRRCLMRANAWLVGTPFNVPESILPVRLETLVEHIEARLAAERA